MVRPGAALAFSRADAAFSAALRAAISRARLRGVIDQGMGPVLFALEARGVLSMSALAKAACVPRSTMTGVIDRMEERGLVRTAPNPEDARGIVVGLSAKGRAVVPRLRGVEQSLDERIRDAFTKGESESLVALLDRFAAAFGSTS
jgi:DNA-binding MarR family transcriptional regulator